MRRPRLTADSQEADAAWQRDKAMIWRRLAVAWMLAVLALAVATAGHLSAGAGR